MGIARPAARDPILAPATTEGQSLREIARGVGVSLALVHGEVKAAQQGVWEGMTTASPSQITPDVART
ncbi:hypothetical protein [Nocardia sp. NPDC047038]|uniref:hypothetical protein n=1 Tax=Nocardia sp. NPDC047038 TaxID=3154338 RepID=UPI0033F499BD